MDNSQKLLAFYISIPLRLCNRFLHQVRSFAEKYR